MTPERGDVGRGRVEDVHDASSSRHGKRIERKGTIVNLLRLPEQDDR